MMKWLFLGYGCGVCAALVVAAAVVLPAQVGRGTAVEPLLIALGFAMGSGAQVFLQSKRASSDVNEALSLRLIRRSSVLRAGVITGAVVILLVAGLFWTIAFGTHSPVVAAIASSLVLVAAPPAVAGWLVSRSRRVLRDTGGFSVIHKPHAVDDGGTLYRQPS
jgi:hypothetical protein